MYLMRNLYIDKKTNQVVVEPGIKVTKVGQTKDMYINNTFWGTALVHLGTFADESKFYTKLPDIELATNCHDKARKETYLTYISEYDCIDVGDNYVELRFSVSMYEEDRIDGYFVFLEHEEGIISNGTKLYQRYPDEAVYVLTKGQSIQFAGRRCSVTQDGKFILET